jgi:probable F420-dependent oxidoreductase
VAEFSQVAALARLAEELEFDSVWVMDHLFNVGYIRTRLEDRPYYSPLATLSFVAALTQRIRLGTSVLVLPYHNPVELAKYAATLDHMSGGRLVLGIGAGGLGEEFEALGVPMMRRGSMTNEAIAVMKELWTSPDPRFEGRYWRFSDVLFSPKPLQRPHPPLWIGGSSPAALRRAALQGDGWHPTGASPQQFRAGAEEVRRQAAAAGRDPARLTMSVRVAVTTSAADGRGVPGLDPSRMLEALLAYAVSGAEHAVLAPESGDVQEIEKVMRLIAAEVIPALV